MALPDNVLNQLEKFADAVAEDYYRVWRIEHRIVVNELYADMSDLMERYRDLIPSGEGMDEMDQYDMSENAFDMLRDRIGEPIEDNLFEDIFTDFSHEFDGCVDGSTDRFNQERMEYVNAREEFIEKTRDWFEGERLPILVEERIEKMADDNEISGADFDAYYRTHSARVAAQITREFERDELPKMLEEFRDEYIYGPRVEDE